MTKNEKTRNLISELTNEQSSIDLIHKIKIYRIINKVLNDKDIEYIKFFIRFYYDLEKDFSEDFYLLLSSKKNKLETYEIIFEKNIFLLISYLRFGKENIEFLRGISPYQYFSVPKKSIKKIMELLNDLDLESNDNLILKIEDAPIWKLRRYPNYDAGELELLAYKIYLSIGFNNAIELLTGKYGYVDYQRIYFMFSKLDVDNNIDDNEIQALDNFLFGNKKDANNIMYQVLNGSFNELFLNFDYFYNNISEFIKKLGTKMSRNKILSLLEERYVSKEIQAPELTGEIIDDMISSYRHKYDDLVIPEEEIIKKNMQAYNDYLKHKIYSSIPMIKINTDTDISAEIIPLNDPKNLVMGYRAGNCFRLNGEASVLFYSFLKSEHMRIVSFSTEEYKDYAMMLVMRNGNVLIGQGIETSKRVPTNIKGKKLYDTSKIVLKQLMDYLNSNGDEIVATIIGRTNENVANYNNDILPFLINPILKNQNNYYNGIDNYQCLLDLKEGKTDKDIKLFTPERKYQDDRLPVLRRTIFNYNDYFIIEKRLISLRYLRFQQDLNLYGNLLKKEEIYSCCNVDWYITLFSDGSIDSFIISEDPRAVEEFNNELESLTNEKNNLIKQNSKLKRTL